VLAPAETVVDALRTVFEDRRDSVVVYADPDGETVLHEGPATVRANGWIELPSGRLLSPSAVHHVDRDP
jgi:prophage tail gpP-like protein